jgi:hypothetical protein
MWVGICRWEVWISSLTLLMPTDRYVDYSPSSGGIWIDSLQSYLLRGFLCINQITIHSQLKVRRENNESEIKCERESVCKVL